MPHRLHTRHRCTGKQREGLLNFFISQQPSMRQTSQNDEDGTAYQRKEALVVVAFVHPVKLDDGGQHVRVIVLKVFCHVVEPGVLRSKEGAGRYRLWLSFYSDRRVFERTGNLFQRAPGSGQVSPVEQALLVAL